jgi:Peptidase family M23
MRTAIKSSLFALLILSPFLMQAQAPIKLVCPFEKGSGREPKEAYSWEPRDEKVIMISNVDTIVRSSVNGTVSNVNMTEDNRYEIVVYYKNYYFWYYGVSKALVKVNQNVTAGQSIGTYKLGTELEFRMYKDEQQMDPRNLLECKIPRADE